MTLTVDLLRGYITTALSDEALDALLDAAYEAIDQYAGASGSITELISPGPGDLLMLSRRASAISSLKEKDIALATDDYQLHGDQLVRRLDTGTNPAWRWRGRVDVTYTALTDTASRDRVAIALVNLDLDFAPGLTSQRLGDFSETADQRPYDEQRAEILASLFATFMAA